ncbi:MAG: glycosyltransferase family 4 protein [Chitinophagaceae bacterium]
MKIAVLASIAWRTPPRMYGPWEQVASNLTEGLVNRGIDVTMFATADSQTKAKLVAVINRPYAEDPDADAKVNECLHISELMERAVEFDLIHNHFDFLPLTYSLLAATPMLTTIHGFSSPRIVPVYKKYNRHSHYVSISNSDRHPDLDYLATVYNGIDVEQFTPVNQPGDYLLYFGRIHPHKGALEAIQVARRSGVPLLIAGLIQDQDYFSGRIEPLIDGVQTRYIGNVGPDERNVLLGGALGLLHLISFEEPFGLSVAEAMCCGTPVIAFNRGSMPELIDEGVTGFLVQNEEEAVNAVTKLRSINRAECAGLARIRFSKERMVDEYIRLYQGILGGNKTS